MTLSEYTDTINIGIVKWFQKAKKSAPTPESRLLLDRMQAVISRGGKRARPGLLYMTYSAYGRSNPAELIDAGLALEFHHQFLLFHDDIIDKDYVRYGGPNIAGYYLEENGPDISEAMELLAGDMLYSFSNQVVAGSRALDDKQKVVLLTLLNEVNSDVAYGQQLDVFNLDPASADFAEKLLLTHALKTASYSTQLPMQFAAALLDLPAPERDKLVAFARPYGVLFQLVDDYSDYFTNNSAFNNRPKYRDFRQGKITYPLYAALQTANKSQAEYLKRCLGNKDLSDTKMAKVVTILEKSGAKKESQKHLEQFFANAFSALDKLSINPEQKQKFRQMIEKYQV
jgi:geranylgeranyl diphosphate synthase type II